MTPAEYRDALTTLGLSQLAAGRLFGVAPRTAQRWAVEGPPRSAAMLLRLAIKHGYSGEALAEL